MNNINWDRPIGMGDCQRLGNSFEKTRSTGSAFGNASGIDNEQGPIWRTRSLDAGLPMATFGEGCDYGNQPEARTAASEALHSSFDASLFEDNRKYTSIFRCNSKHSPERHSPTRNQDDPDLGASSGRKHLLQQVATESNEPTDPGTVRKLARHSTKESAGGKTPVRSRPKSTPDHFKETLDSSTLSTVRRRRAPLNHRKSPLRRVLPPPPSRETGLHQPTTIISPKIGLYHETPLVRASSTGECGASLSSSTRLTQAMTPTRNLRTSIFSNSTIKSSKVNFTGTTADSTILEKSSETESAGTYSPTAKSFRFSSFPASLPRINNVRSNRPCPDSVRKRMSFGECTGQSPVNQSRDDDGTQNTSLSSLSADGAQHVARTESLEMKSDVIGDSGEQLTFAGPVQSRLFLDDDYGYSSDDDSTASPLFGHVGRTRLNFNLLVSPPEQKSGLVKEAGHTGDFQISCPDSVIAMPMGGIGDLSKPYEQRRISSFPSTASSHTPLRNVSGCDDFATTSTAGLTPSRSAGETRIESHLPGTPHEVQLHFQLNVAQCSPIPGVQEEEGVDSDVQHAATCGMEDDSFAIGAAIETQETLEKTKTTDESGLSLSQGSASSSTSSRRRLRPMPDMSAFETDALSSSRNDRSGDESMGNESKGHASSPKLLCPPTPVRTPAWAHNEPGGPSSIFQRSNSLIATRVLATCSPQLFDRKCLMDSTNPAFDSHRDSVSRDLVETRNEEKNADTAFSISSQIAPHLRIRHDFIDNGDKGVSQMPQTCIKPPRLHPRFTTGEVGSYISFATDFHTLGLLGSGTFADVYKVRSKLDNRLYAVKRNRRQFRGKRDRDMALAEVRCMQRLQNICANPAERNFEENSRKMQYLLFFVRAWQEDGHFFCQTELCCRDTCRELMDSLRTQWNWAKSRYPSIVRNLPAPTGLAAGSSLDTEGRLVPEMTVWKICHDISAGLAHIHSHGLVHHDIKPSNIFFVPEERYGALCKIGDFGMAADIGTSEDGQEGDQKYMALELLTSGVKSPSADMFSLGLTLYEIASDLSFEIPSEGPRWHGLRSGSHIPELPASRSTELASLIKTLIHPQQQTRPHAEAVLKNIKVREAGSTHDNFLCEYIKDIDENDKREEMMTESDQLEEHTPRNGQCRPRVCSPVLGHMLPNSPPFLSPAAKPT